MAQWKIGCSGYYYAEWKGLFYPPDLPKNKWFEFYCTHFNTIELNTTFYRFPRTEFLRGWYRRSPADFMFSVKAPRLITHIKRLKDAQRYLSDFYKTVGEGLKEKVACMLFQFPANYIYQRESLDHLVALLHRDFTNVVEFRHVSWWNAEVFAALEANGIAFSGMSHPQLPDDVIKTAPTIYYRFHGVPNLYISRYRSEQLETIAKKIQTVGASSPAYLYFNNTAEGAAIDNARELLSIGELVH